MLLIMLWGIKDTKHLKLAQNYKGTKLIKQEQIFMTDGQTSS